MPFHQRRLTALRPHPNNPCYFVTVLRLPFLWLELRAEVVTHMRTWAGGGHSGMEQARSGIRASQLVDTVWPERVTSVLASALQNRTFCISTSSVKAESMFKGSVLYVLQNERNRYSRLAIHSHVCNVADLGIERWMGPNMSAASHFLAVPYMSVASILMVESLRDFGLMTLWIRPQRPQALLSLLSKALHCIDHCS